MSRMLDRMNFLQNEMLIHSYLYYKLGDSIISDALFDVLAKELVSIQKRYPEIQLQTIYSDTFKNFDGTTGYHLLDVINDEQKKRAEVVLYWNKI